jgi:hypothetical protein
MRFQTKWMHVAFSGFMIVVLSSTGCKSGWKMPGKDMFSWGRKPSETTLAGAGPSTTYPKSPALTSTPTQIPNSSSTKPNAPLGMNSYASTGANGMGSAAAANGYQTGPYGTSASAMTQTPSMASAQPGSANSYGGANTYGVQNPYGASNPYGTASTATPAANQGYAYNGAAGSYSLPSRPTGLAGAATNTAGTTGAYGAGTAGPYGAGTAGSFGSPSAQPGASTAMNTNAAPGYGMPTFGPPSNGPQVYGQPSTGLTSSVSNPGQAAPYTPSSPAGSAGTYAGANPYSGSSYQATNPYAVQPSASTGNPYVATGTSAAGSAGNPYAINTASAPAATANSYATGGTTPASYSPGSTQRPTVYSNNFAQPGASGATSAGGYSAPAMATPSYMAPPSNLTR